MLEVRYRGMRIVVSHSALTELMNSGKTLCDVLEILEYGRGAPRSRKSGTLERWLDKDGKTFNAVLAQDYSSALGEECWVLVHFGKFTKSK